MKNTQGKEAVIAVSKKITPQYSQIVIDLFQDDLEDLLDDENVTPDAIGAFNYNVDILIEVFNPSLLLDISLLKELAKTLEFWNKEKSIVNRLLGLDPNE